MSPLWLLHVAQHPKIVCQPGTMEAARRTRSSRVDSRFHCNTTSRWTSLLFVAHRSSGILPSGGGVDNTSDILDVTFMVGLGIYDNRKHILLRTEIGTITGRGGSRRPSFSSSPISFYLFCFPFFKQPEAFVSICGVLEVDFQVFKSEKFDSPCIRTAA